MKRLIAMTLFAGLAAAPMLALAGPRDGGQKDGGHWKQLDKDGDGQITLSEMTDHQRAFFSKADTDGNGAISEAEMKALHEARRAEMEARRFPDANGDGNVSKSEFDAAADERFDRLDANGDGALSKDEMKDGRRRHGPKPH